MNYDLVEQIALVSGGNAVLANRIPPEAFLPDDSTLAGSDRVTFERPGPGTKLLASPRAWIAFLARNNVRRIHLVTGFDGCFEKGLHSLESASPLRNCGHHPLTAARSYPLEARQLFAAFWHSWVVGGMGSWNDTGFTNQRVMNRFTRVTRELSTALLKGVRVAVNSFPQPGHRA